MSEQTLVPAGNSAPQIPMLPVPGSEPAEEKVTPQAGAVEEDTKPPATDEDGAKAENGKDEEEKRKPRRSASERIHQLTAGMRQQERTIGTLVQRIRELEQPIVSDAQREQLSPEQEVHVNVREAVRAEQAMTARQQIAAEQQVAHQMRAVQVTEWLEEGAARNPEFKDIFHNDLPISDDMTDELLSSEHGYAIAEYLGKNDREARRISRLPPRQQIREMARIEARIAAAPEPRKTTQAPPPPRTVTGQFSSREKAPDQMSAADFSTWWQKRGKT